MRELTISCYLAQRPMSYIADRLSITLSLYFGITEQEQIKVTDTIRTYIQNLQK
jgi:hypothetical protein